MPWEASHYMPSQCVILPLLTLEISNSNHVQTLSLQSLHYVQLNCVCDCAAGFPGCTHALCRERRANLQWFRLFPLRRKKCAVVDSARLSAVLERC